MNKIRTSGGLRPTLLRCALGAAVVLACAPLAAAQSSAHQTWLRMLSRDDANRNGRIEASEYGGSARAFARFDANADGSLSEDELGVRLATPVLAARSAPTRRAVRAQERRTDEMDKLKLRQAALLFFQLDERDDDARTLDRDEFRRAFWAYDTDGSADVSLRELVDGPDGVERRLTGVSVEAFAEMLHRALDADESSRIDEIEALDWFDREMTGAHGDAVSIATLDRDRSAIARGAFAEISTLRGEPLPSGAPAPALRPVAATAEAPSRGDPARERVAAAKETVRDVPAPIGRGDVVAAAPERVEARPDVGQRAPVVASAPRAGTVADATAREPARVGLRPPSTPADAPARGESTPTRGNPVGRGDRDPAPTRTTDAPARGDVARGDASPEPARETPAEAAPRATITTRAAPEKAPARGKTTSTSTSTDRASAASERSASTKDDDAERPAASKPKRGAAKSAKSKRG